MNTAPVKWAQRNDSLYVTITLADVKDHKVELTDKKLTFEGTSNGKQYSLDLVFVSAIFLLKISVSVSPAVILTVNDLLFLCPTLSLSPFSPLINLPLSLFDHRLISPVL
jgi:hypothetical protein